MAHEGVERLGLTLHSQAAEGRRERQVRVDGCSHGIDTHGKGQEDSIVKRWVYDPWNEKRACAYRGDGSDVVLVEQEALLPPHVHRLLQVVDELDPREAVAVPEEAA